MKNSLIIIVMAMMILAAGVAAETEFDFSGQIRIRDEADGKSFTSSDAMLNFVDMRTRINLDAKVNDNVRAYLQIQDSRRMGQFDENGRRLSGELNDGHNLDLHQAYVEIDRIGFERLSFKAGRFEFVMGNERVFGAVGWSNVGRVWDGGQLCYKIDKNRAILFGLKAAERDNEYYNADFDIFGLNLVCDYLHLDAFAFYEYDADTSNYYEGINRLDRMNVGFYYQRQFEQLDFTMNFAYQFGSMAPGIWEVTAPDNNTEELDIAAMMFTFEAGISFEGSLLRRVAAGIDYSSGDDNDGDNKYKAYTNSYYTGHGVRGFMDYFVDVSGTHYEDAGLMDMMFRLEIIPRNDWTIKLDGHYFKTAADYRNPFTSEATTDVGTEIDLTVTTAIIQNVGLAFGASIFSPSDPFSGIRNSDQGYWLYGQATADF
ncbi:MAG TPA: alginate export family protein [candidate division Zixibacteria bacterium]|nr:alginate export family protein [candidate division Zixibacteria bacterium]